MITSQTLPGRNLAGDRFEYKCDENYQFHEGADKDYKYECQEDGSWDSDRTALCITSELLLLKAVIFHLITHFESAHSTVSA